VGMNKSVGFDKKFEACFNMNNAIKLIVGKTIKGVIVKERCSGSPRSQVLIVFSDDTHYELYSDATIQGIGGIDRGGMDHVRSISGSLTKIILEYEM
jgi:hypothetical protein